MAVIGMFDNCLCLTPVIYNCLLLLGDYLPRSDDPSCLMGKSRRYSPKHIHVLQIGESITNHKNYFLNQSVKINRCEKCPVGSQYFEDMNEFLKLQTEHFLVYTINF